MRINKRSLESCTSEDPNPVQPPSHVDYSKACFICGARLPSFSSLGKHKTSHICSNHFLKLTTARSLGGSSLPGSVTGLVDTCRDKLYSKVSSYDHNQYKSLKRDIKDKGHPPIAPVFKGCNRYIQMTRYVQDGYYVNFPLSILLFDLKLLNMPTGKIVLNTPKGSIGECFQFFVSII